MRLALLRTVERAVAERYLAPAVLRNTGQALLLATMESGD